MKRKILQFILKRLKNSNYTSFKECYECAVKRGSPQLCEQCYWVRENYKPNRIIFMNQQEEMLKPFENKSDTNTLREEWNKTAPKGMPQEYQEYMDLVATYWINKFNQKLEEIEESLEKEKINIYPSDNVENYKEKEIRLDYYNKAIARALQIIKNKKNE